MRRLFTALGTAALVASITTLGMSGSAQAGGPQPRMSFNIVVYGVDADGVRDGLTPELYSDQTGNTPVDLSACGSFSDSEFGAFEAARMQSCATLGNGTYFLGLGGIVPPEMTVSFYCFVTEVGVITASEQEVLVDELGEVAEFTLAGADYAECNIFLSAGVVAVDKIIEGGPADSSDFTMNALNGTDIAGSGADPSNATCTPALTECALINIDTSNRDYEFVLDEIPAWGYVLEDISCDSFINLNEYFNEPFEFDPGNSSSTFNVGDGQAYCQVTNRYATGFLEVSTVVINDDGGTATPTDVSFEVFRSDSTTEIVATPCMADGSCYDGTLAIGDYVMGYVGPAGYTVDITQTITPQEREMITDDPDAAFTMEEFDQVDIVITINDPLPATTTTTTTTTPTTVAPTTTVAATTTTALDAGGVTLPGTGGTSSEANGWMATMALLFVASGGALLIARRRTS